MSNSKITPMPETLPIPSVDSGNIVHILVLDDEENSRVMMSRLLKRLGHQVDTADSGPAGLQMLLNQHYEVVIVDQRMGEMDGLTFVREARNVWPWLGVVMCSGYLSAEIRQRAEELSVEFLLEKPVEMEELNRVVVTEAARSRKRFHEEWAASPRNIHSQLAILRQLTDSALNQQSLPHALKEMALGLERLMPCSVIGVLVQEDPHWLLLLHSKSAMPTESLVKVRQEILQRYHALSGTPLPEDKLRQEVEGARSDDAVPDEIKHLISVPVIADHELAGVLCLGESSGADVTGADITFLYHAANHLATLLLALNRMRQQAILDPLTECYNRRYMAPELERAWNLSRRTREPMALMIVDIDHFKEINDTLGHGRGDDVLVQFTRQIRSVIRASDLIMRLGGDEFLLLLPATRRAEAEELARRILAHFRELTFPLDGGDVNLTVSVGIAVSDEMSAVQSHHVLLENADRALYAAKKEGRNSHKVWEQEAPDPQGVGGGLPDVQALLGKSGHGRVLVVDDNVFITGILRTFLEQEGFEVDAAGSVPAAMELLNGRTQDYDVLMTDITLPGPDGFAMLRMAEEVDPHMVRVVVSGHVTAENAIAAMRGGAYDFVQKPFSREQLLSLMSRALEYRRLLTENQRYQNYLEEMVRNKSQEVTRNLGELKAAYDFSLEAMVAMLDAREYETSLHSRRVMELVELLAHHAGIRDQELAQISRGALLHDIGKIAIPDRILQKPGPLTEEETKVMRKHPEIGFNFIKSSPYLIEASEIVLSHHEAYDGSGYPRGLQGNEIALGARIFTVVDSYDAMRSSRIYKAPMTREDSVRELNLQRGRQFDPAIIDLFLEILPEIETIGGWT